ncbi:2Fe-2S iron-sulfur cluster binding domain-containing protein [Sphingomonas ginsenosidivorax]|uniref:2Fe-2S iron-sulfur cluster binding domain-containing protein n=1 Tax=Sphingomonas ginsenosidivorax TaxID=862135 RepID=A0A5C6UKJ8_9SPHN|nr:FAD-binding oxidoreductase [Sphingomonas ginsenosidivorax]TXC72018.1 2Fe-2S iron-sulfur cluster binding domain-containing protein [Sphingomonas ginsenosidivorax]
MSFKIALANNRALRSLPGQSILDAARQQGVVLAYSCRTGRCGICKAPLLAGDTALLRSEAESLTPDEAAGGLILTCCRTPTSDIVLDIESLDRLAGFETKTVPARIVSIERLARDIARVVLKTPPASPMRFLPGQYVDVIAEGVRRSYSLANAPRGDGLLELLIKRYKGGTLSEYWFERAKANDLLRIEGPFGTFFLREEGPTNIVFLATGTGIAPVKALLEELAANPERAALHRLTVFWGNREAESFCWDPVGLGLDVGVHHLLSGADAYWNAARGYVHDAAIRQGIDPDDTVVYACGSNAMITSARETLLALGLPANRFFSDAFVSSN